MQSGQPSCFGKLWDPNNAECRGGNDPSYSNPKTGSARRDICRWYSACSAETNRAKLENAVRNAPPAPPAAQPYAPVQPPHVPMGNVVRPPPAAPPNVGIPVAQTVGPPVPLQTQAMMLQPVQQQQVAYVGGAPYTQPGFAAQPVLVPVNQPMPGAQVPSFLTVPEPSNPDVPMGTRLWRTVYRSMLKAGFVGAANFMDYNPLTPPKGG